MFVARHSGAESNPGIGTLMSENMRFLVPWAGVGAMALWWVLAPSSVIRLHRSLGSRTAEWLGPGVVRGLGVLLLAMAGVAGALFILKG